LSEDGLRDESERNAKDIGGGSAVQIEDVLVEQGYVQKRGSGKLTVKSFALTS